MKTLILAFLTFLCFARCEAETDYEVCKIPSLIDGKEMVARVLASELHRAPRWENILNNPPLEPKVAISQAQKYAETFRPNGLIMETGDIELKKLNTSRYVYVVQLFFVREGSQDGFSAPLNVVVLMNGTVVKFTQADQKK